MGEDVEETVVFGLVAVLSKCAVITETSSKAGEVEIVVTEFSVLLVALVVLRDAAVTEAAVNEVL